MSEPALDDSPARGGPPRRGRRPGRPRPGAARGRRRASAARCACWPARAPARPARSPTGSPTASTPASTRRSRCSRSRSPPARPARCAPGCATSASAACRPARSTPRRCASCSYFWPPRRRRRAARRCSSTRRALVADAAARLRLQRRPRRRARPRRRDRVGQGRAADAARLRRAARAAAGARAPGRPRRSPTVARLIEVYEEVKTERGGHRLRGRAAAHRRASSRSTPDVAPTVRAQYRHFVVDEYQDVNALQQRLLDLWLGERDDVCVVGDPSQTIYSFTGATPEHLLGFPRRFPRRTDGAAGARLPLDAAGRRAGQPAAAAGGPAGGAARGPAPLRAGRAAAARPGAGADAPATTTSPRPPPSRAGSRTLVGQGVPAARDRGAVPDQRASPSRSSRRWPTPACLRACAAASGSSTAARCARPCCCCAVPPASATTGDEPLGEDVRGVLAAAGWSAEAARRRRRRPRAVGVAAGARRPGRRARGAAARRDARATLVAELDERAAAQHAPAVEGVTLASLHAAKGLEWDAVFLVGLTEGLMPITLADGWEAVEEERRLLYVGITRAREHLHAVVGAGPDAGRPGRPAAVAVPRRACSRRTRPAAAREARTARAEGGGKRTRRSLPTTCRTCGAVARHRGRAQGRALRDCPPTYDEELFERLREWRSATASEAGVPAYVVFTDATLVAIAETLPRDVGGAGADPRRRAGEARQVRRGGAGHCWPS